MDIKDSVAKILYNDQITLNSKLLKTI